MPRQLRQRTSRPNYAALLRFDDEDDEGGPSNMAPPIDDDAESGSDFTPAPEGDKPEEESADDELDADADADDDEKMSVVPASEDEGSIIASQPVSKIQKKAPKKRVSLAPGISVRQQSTANSTLPNTHHRHRALPLYHRAEGARAERLASAPSPFTVPPVIATTAYSEQPAEPRVPKAWSYNVGPGPLWDLMEDRGFFKEAPFDEDERESVRRPRVHERIKIKHETVRRLSDEEATVYQTKGQIKCSFGRYPDQEQLDVKVFDTIRMDKYFPEDVSHVFSAGAPVWALDWCPVTPDGRDAIQQRQYLAVGPLPSHDYVPRIGVKRCSPACIQIWSVNPTPVSEGASAANGRGKKHDPGFMRCDMVLCIDSGPAYELKWCPLPSHDLLQPSGDPPEPPRKLGLLAGTFEDGSLCVYAVPYPPDVSGETEQNSGPVYVKISEPLLRIALEDTVCWSLDWANSEVLAIGCTNGNIAVYNIVDAINSKDPLPSHFYSAHQSAIRAVTWVRTPTYDADGEVTADDPTVIISAGYDGVQHAVDLRCPSGNDISRTRDAINLVRFSTYCGGHISVDQGYLKAISLSPVLLNKGHTILDPEGPVWDVGASDYHPQVAAAVADGSVITTNTMRNTRRGGSVPFLSHTIYQLDYNRKTGEYRMVDHLKPKEVPRIGGKSREPPKASGAWSPEVSITRVAWNQGNGLANACWLASATASGLCRVDWLSGKWLQDKLPYRSIEGIRGEVEVEDESDDDDDDY
ncbi:hypothetical protein PsYK624_068310 [Phanerochaete sordida]|uniref:WD40 repeat-like protein n=1 Tax=Phanerochaete sordida TaxID=48140 RepID=A0A9P3LE76_9APHY|nr:hypothetical protein PsYK624_068310 [Phanerochaete sordida]